MPGVGLMVRVVGLGSSGPEFKFLFSVEFIPGGVDSACHPSKVGKMSASLLAAPTLCLLRQHQRSAQSLVPIDGCAPFLLQGLLWDPNCELYYLISLADGPCSSQCVDAIVAAS